MVMGRLIIVSLAVFAFLCLVGFAVFLFDYDSGATRVPHSQGSTEAHKKLPPGALPKPKHVVIVVEENKAYSQIIDNEEAPFINKLATEGASFRYFYAITHPSEPNYLALFSGSTQGLIDDSCPHHYSGANLASALAQAGYSFATYSQSLPQTGFRGCSQGRYRRRHNPAVNWQGLNVDARQNQPFSAFPQDFAKLPTVAFVIPDLDHDMHDGSIAAGDTWLKQNLGRYAQWVQHHNSLLIVTFDEDDDSEANRIATLIVGARVQPGQYDRPVNLYNLLRILEAMYNLPRLGKSAQAVPITQPWRSSKSLFEN
jgi:acid phosphatase